LNILTYFSKSSEYKISQKNPCSGNIVCGRAGGLVDVWTDGRTDKHDEANSRFSQRY